MSGRAVLLLGLAAGGAAQAVHLPGLVRPYLFADDWAVLLQSWTAADARRNLWEPVNEHCWPLTRLAAYAVVRAAGGAAGLPLAAAVATRVALAGVMGLTYLFVRRERGEPLPGLVAAALFGVTAVYQEAVVWFAAGPGLAATGTVLLALLSAQRWHATGRRRHLLAVAGWSALAPAWFAGGLLAGPLVALHLAAGPGRRRAAWVPLAGTAAFLLVSLPRSGDRILHADHYGGQTAVQAFDPLTGAVNTGRALVDTLLPGAVGVRGMAVPPAAVPAGLLAAGAGWVWWWRRAVDRRLVLLGTAMIASNYLAIYSGRAGWPYETALRGWSRYHVGPQLGLALVVAGGRRPGGWAGRRPPPVLAAGLIAGLLAVHLPGGWTGGPAVDPAQARVLRLVDATDRRCREGHVSKDAAVAALTPLPIPGGTGENAWWLLRGSPDPAPHPAAEVRRRLGVTESPAPPP